MAYLVTLCILSFVLLAGLVGVQLAMMKRGSARAKDQEIENPLSRHNMAIVGNSALEWLEVRTRKMVLYTLRFSIKIGYFVKMKLDAIVSGVQRKMVRHERKLIKEEAGGKNETFLKTIGDYKHRIRRFRKGESETVKKETTEERTEE